VTVSLRTRLHLPTRSSYALRVACRRVAVGGWLLWAAACGGSEGTPQPDAAGGDLPDAASPESSQFDAGSPESGGDTHADVAPEPVDLAGPLGRIDYAYELDLSAADPQHEPRSFALASGALPPGLSLAASGTVQGTPSTSGPAKAVVHAQGACGTPACLLEIRLSIRIADVVLLSGFGPFAGVPENPSWLAVAALDREMVAGHDVRAVLLPVTWQGAPAAFFPEYDRLRPVIAVASGVDTGAKGVELESQAANKASGMDVDGISKNNEPIDPAGPASLPTLLPVDQLRGALEADGFQASISSSAGTYLCNFMFYELMQKLATEPPAEHRIGGFVHVPSAATLAPADMTGAWRLMIARLVEYRAGL
jgi:pyroglutamyl-peptidase